MSIIRPFFLKCSYNTRIKYKWLGHTADASILLMHWCCWCKYSTDALILLIQLRCWCTDADDVLILLMWVCADAVTLLMQWCYGCADADDASMLLMQWFCWYAYAVSVDAPMMLKHWCCWWWCADHQGWLKSTRNSYLNTGSFPKNIIWIWGVLKKSGVTKSTL